jgi:hypothetical protein
VAAFGIGLCKGAAVFAVNRSRRACAAAATAFLIFAMPLVCATDARAETPAVDVLVIGDSQITFGAGAAFLPFFEMVRKSCDKQWSASARPRLSDTPSVGIIGVRSTSLGAWTNRSGRGKRAICDVDPKWNVNAGSYGVLNRSPNPYIQIGRGDDYQFCEDGKSAFEAMFAQGYYDPKLLVMFFLGNSAETWASDPETALQEVRRTMAQIPHDLPCIFITSAPAYREDTIALRLRAQDNILAAFAQAGSRCSVVAGHTPETIALNLGNARHFRRRESGGVRDPFHPNAAAQQAFVQTLSGAICAAIAEQLP